MKKVHAWRLSYLVLLGELLKTDAAHVFVLVFHCAFADCRLIQVTWHKYKFWHHLRKLLNQFLLLCFYLLSLALSVAVYNTKHISKITYWCSYLLRIIPAHLNVN